MRGYLKNEVRTSKFWVVCGMVLIFTQVYTKEIILFSHKVKYGITPWIVIFFSTTRFPRLIMLVLYLFLICDIPFRKENDTFFLVRSERKAFCIGNIFYIIANALIFIVVVTISSWLWGIKDMEWSMQWGKILGTVALTDIADNYRNSIIISGKLILREKPWVCYMLMFGLNFLCNIFLGNLLMIVNLWRQKKNLGIIVGTFLIGIDFFIQTQPQLWKYIYYSPITWSNLCYLDLKNNVTEYPSVWYAIICYLGLNIFLGNILIRMSRRLEICEGLE